MNLLSILTFVWAVIAALGLGATALIVLQCARASPAASVAAPALSVRLGSPERKCLPRRLQAHGAEQIAIVGPAAQCAADRVQRLRLSKMQMLPSDNGVLSARLATAGAVAPAGQELCRLIRASRLEWRADADPSAPSVRLPILQIRNHAANHSRSLVIEHHDKR
jgi:hypothetical protein